MTSYSDIYSVFFSKVTDYSFLQLEEVDVEEILKPYLISSITKFKKRCRLDLSDRIDMIDQFNIDLSDEEIEILASLMIVEYLSPQIVNLELIRQNMSNKDWKLYSQANHLKELKDLRNESREEAERLIMEYTYDNSLEDLS